MKKLSCAALLLLASSGAFAKIFVDCKAVVNNKEFEKTFIFDENQATSEGKSFLECIDENLMVVSSLLECTAEDMTIEFNVYSNAELVSNPVVRTAWNKEAVVEIANQNGELIKIEIIAHQE